MEGSDSKSGRQKVDKSLLEVETGYTRFN